jgi:non-heme chloroperoxidase
MGTVTTMKRLILLALFAVTFRASAQFDELPSTNHFVTTADGVKIHCAEKGEGAAVLFIPGWTIPGDIWKVQVDRFAGHHRIVTMDPRCQGESSQTTNGLNPAVRAQDIKAVVDDLKLAPVILVGWSSGVTEIASYVDQFGTGTIAGLVFVDGMAGVDLPAGMKAEELPYVEQMKKDRASYADKFVPSMFKQPHSELFLTNLIAATLKMPTDAAVALMIASVKADNRPALGKIDKPTLIIVATIPKTAYEPMQKSIKGSRVEVFENAGHAVFIDEPAKFNLALGDFFTGLKSKPESDPRAN